MESTQACFPEDMAWGCYLIEVGGGTNDAGITWHLYGFDVFGSYVVDYSAGVAQEWSWSPTYTEVVDGETTYPTPYLLTGDSGTDCDDESGFCEGGMDYPTGAGVYEIDLTAGTPTWTQLHNGSGTAPSGRYNAVIETYQNKVFIFSGSTIVFRM